MNSARCTGRQAGTKHIYRPVWSVSRWDEFVRTRAVGTIVQLCAGNSRIGVVRIDRYREAPAANVIADFHQLPLRPGCAETVACDPPYELGYPDRVVLQRLLARLARRVILFKAPWIPRARGWALTEAVLLHSHTCANVAVLSRLEHVGARQGSLPL